VAELVKILRRREVERFTGLRRSSIYEGMGEGTFPRAVTIGRKSIGWLEPEIITWQQQRIAQRDAQSTRPQRQRRRSKNTEST
jgi:prophage regulatory protein